MASELDVMQAFVDAAVMAVNQGELSAIDAAKGKLRSSELQKSVVDRCLQLLVATATCWSIRSPAPTSTLGFRRSTGGHPRSLRRSLHAT
jgi:hypothetical protein